MYDQVLRLRGIIILETFLKKSIFWSFFPQQVHYAPHFKGMIRNMSSYLNDWTGRLSMTKWLWQVMLCPAVACWLLGLSVIWLAWQQLCPMSQNGIWVWESISDWQYRTFSVMWLTLGTGCTLVLFKHQDNVDSWFQKVSWVKGVFDRISHPSLLHMLT